MTASLRKNPLIKRSTNIELFNGIRSIGAYGVRELFNGIRSFVAMLRQKRLHFQLNCVHLLHKMAEKVTPDVTLKLISVNCITQCLK